MSYTPVPVGNQFIRNFPVPLDRDFVFSSTQARNDYITDGATSGIAYTGMIVGDLQTNKAYILNTNRAWQEIGGLDAGNNIVISSANSTSNPVVSLSSSLTGLNNIFATGSISGNNLTISNSATFLSDINVSGNINVLGTGISFNEATVVLTTLDVANSGNFGNALTVGGTGVSLQGHSHVSTDITDFVEASQDAIATNAGSTGFLRNGSGVAWTYNDNADTLSVAVTGIPVSLITDLDSYIAENLDTSIVQGTGIGLVYDTELKQLSINVTGVSLAGHSHILTDIIDVSASATEVNYLDGSVPGTAVSGKALVLDTNKDITGIRNITTEGTLNIGGDLIVHGTTTTVNSTTVNIGDNVIRVNTSGLNTGGFEVYKSGSDPLVEDSYETLLWNTTNNRWDFSGPTVRSTGVIVGRTLESTVSGPTAPFVVASTGLVANLNSDLLDGQHGSYYLDWTKTTNKPTITGILSGDVAGTGSVALGDLGGLLTINATVQPNSVELGTDTTGQYASTISVSGTGLSGTSANASDGTAYTISINATPACSTGTIVARDSSGDFCARVITASGFIGSGNLLTNLNASNITAGTLSTGIFPTYSVPSTSPISLSSTSSFVTGLVFDSIGRVADILYGMHNLATTGLNGIARFSSNSFDVSTNVEPFGGGGLVTIKTSGISNSQLAYSWTKIGATELVLGSTVNSISGVSSNNPLVLTYAHIDGGTP